MFNTWYGKSISIYDPRTSLKADCTEYKADELQLIQNSALGLTVSLGEGAGAPWGGNHENSLEYL